MLHMVLSQPESNVFECCKDFFFQYLDTHLPEMSCCGHIEPSPQVLRYLDYQLYNDVILFSLGMYLMTSVRSRIFEI